MRRILFYLMVLIAVPAAAQEAELTQYYLNHAGYNAGYTGVEDYLDVHLGFRQGWNTFAIRNNSFFASAYGSINRSSKASIGGNSLRLSNPDVISQLQASKEVRRKHGVGGMVSNRSIGPYQLTAFNANYAYHLPLAGKVNLAMGTRLGVQNQRIDFSGYTVRDEVNDAFYRQLMNSSQGNHSSFTTDFGIALYNEKFNIGISSFNLVSSKISGEQLIDTKATQAYYLQAALTSLRIASELELCPGGRVFYSPGYDIQWNVNGRVRYKELVYGGLGFSNQGPKMSLLFGLSLKGLNVNYAYDKYYGSLNNFNVSMHELVVGMILLNKRTARTTFW